MEHVIEAYGSSAQDVYTAIYSPTFFDGRINDAVDKLNYDTLREAIKRVGQTDPGDGVSHTIFSMQETESPGRAHLRLTRGFEVVFKSHSIKSKVLQKLDFLHHLNTAVMIKEFRSVGRTSSYAGFLYEAFGTRELASGKSFPGLVSMRAKRARLNSPN